MNILMISNIDDDEKMRKKFIIDYKNMLYEYIKVRGFNN